MKRKLLKYKLDWLKESCLNIDLSWIGEKKVA